MPCARLPADGRLWLFIADVAGQYVAQLTVNDGIINSAPDTGTITTLGGNTAPVANAGPDQTVQTGMVVTLDGNMSRDADGNPLTFLWALTTKPIGSVTADSATFDLNTRKIVLNEVKGSIPVQTPAR